MCQFRVKLKSSALSVVFLSDRFLRGYLTLIFPPTSPLKLCTYEKSMIKRVILVCSEVYKLTEDLVIFKM